MLGRVRTLGVVLACAMAAATAHAGAAPTVAVMPFKDLSGQKASIGEAIRETVTTDLKDVPGLRVIERGNLDKVLAEQNLQASKTDLDPLSTVKVGKLLGATLIVAGAYQKAGPSVRLTARFVQVETGEVVGTAKVDGSTSDFLSLQDRVTVELLRSVGPAIDQRHVERFVRRARPKIRSLRTVELYGDAVVEANDQKKADYLKQALVEDPGFTYALKDLDALEKRLKKYAAQASVAQDRSVAETREKLAKETDPQKRSQLALQVMSQLLAARRYRTLITEARVLAADPASAQPGAMGVRIDELASFYILTCENLLKQRDPLLRDGEAFLKKFPTSMYFKSIEGMLETAIAQRRKEEEGKTKVADELAKLESYDRWDLCRVARVYRAQSQHKEAQRLFRACSDAGTAPKVQALRELIMADIELGDWVRVRQDLAALEQDGSEDARSFAHGMAQQVPADG
jgi:TolB-like protein